MCGCTLYDSPTCGHSWLSMSQPCGFLSDLLSCPNRQTIQTLIALPYTCPMCNGGFADRETIEMVQGPWGTNQMIRNNIGGSHAIPGQWGHASLMSSESWRGPAITSGALVSATAGPMNAFQYDHRLTGPYGSLPMDSRAPFINDSRMMWSDGGVFDNNFFDDGGWAFRHGGKKSRHKSKYRYRYSDKASTNCVVM